MKPVSQTIYKEMQKLNLLKVETAWSVKEKKIVVIYKNYRVANEHKRSKQKTYYIEEPTYNDYIATIG